jgi:uncharacterized protein (DUF58 family)
MEIRGGTAAQVADLVAGRLAAAGEAVAEGGDRLHAGGHRAAGGEHGAAGSEDGAAAGEHSAAGGTVVALDPDMRVTLVVERVTDALLDLDPARVTISLLDGPHLSEAPLALLTRLRVHGFGLGIADFGAGRATLGDLAKLPLTEVQLAASTVQNATGTPYGAEALAAIVESLHQQGVSVVGAGCDSKSEWLLLLDLGVERAQGAYVP